jgi:hypothetical protein
LQANDDDLVKSAVNIKMRSQVRAGEMLIEGKKLGQIKMPSEKSGTKASTASIGLTKNESSAYQKLAQ